MRTAKPSELKEQAFPLMTARISEGELSRWFPVAFEEITDPWATAEPSKGALVKLETGQYAVIYWGYDSNELAVHIPQATDPSSFLSAFLNEVPVPRTRVSWHRPGTRLPRHVAAKTLSVSRGQPSNSRRSKSPTSSRDAKRK